MKRINTITPLNSPAMKEAQELQASLAKPAGSLGELERITIQLAGITGTPRNSITRKVI
ncbi:MAG: nicotinate-nucleotide--dimethylbenzimidazole phosphoribosyltransferase, partial [Synergistaceae bacterium]|nr:nicotinate-nucleotide--dimethylbenzimidazole phosphoribosyltransferase [Synergistaceae bacterium]